MESQLVEFYQFPSLLLANLETESNEVDKAFNLPSTDDRANTLILDVV